MVTLLDNVFSFAALCKDTAHDRFRCDGIVVHCVVWCDEIPDCRDGFDEAHCPTPEIGCQGDGELVAYLSTRCPRTLLSENVLLEPVDHLKFAWAT